ncbi:MAG: amino acid ABC transporter substrate-binding protein [Actinobacteria bacterium]|nr:amino acid ABC transporter substrate-binding protein [Actinomycetota bacterium]
MTGQTHPASHGRLRARTTAGKLALGTLAVLVLSLAAALGASAHRSAGTINAAVIAPFSGPAANLGKFISLSCYAAAEQVNGAGGVLGNQLGCTTVDDTGDPADAVPAVARALATSNISFASGLETNTAAVTVPLMNDAKVPFFTAAGLPAFDKTADQYFWRITPSDAQNGAAYAVWAKLKKYKSAAIVLQSNAGNDTAGPGIIRALKSLGIKITIKIDIPGEAASYASVVSRVKAKNPAVIITATDPQTAATFFSQYKQLNNGKVPPLITATASLTPDFFDAMTKVLGASFVTSNISLVGYHVAPSSAAFAAYKAGLASSSHVSPSDAKVVSGIGVIAGLYDGDIIMALAMTAANSSKGSDFNKFIPKVTTAGKGKVVVHTYAAGLAALKAKKQIDYVGTGGQIHFNQYHNSAGNFSATAFNTDGSPRLLSVFGAGLIANALK